MGMKCFIMLAGALLLASLSFSASGQDDETKIDSSVKAFRISELNKLKKSLQEQIAEAESNRNQTAEGVLPETQELLNERQDSVCLVLISRLVSVELELKELVPDKTMSTIVEQYNVLLQNHSK